ncbi:major centromere autoantigen B-like [Dreissena polymorpha]|uniref:major centromere autoantigen B-like n=1 Tax=Dreissena polymorpha TaxID=45954 RepID=UPI002264325A|nr:major centromere autoantigen B-like [Dreissena polymorpha]
MATKAKSMLQNYNPDDIYNADETGLFLKMLPDKTNDYKGPDCKDGKKSKNRITSLVCANMSGTDKMPLFVIDKAHKPRCFKNVRTLPRPYTGQNRAWIDQQLFTEWITNIDKKMRRAHRKIAMEAGRHKTDKGHQRQEKAGNTLLDALNTLQQSWECVTATTIRNCLQHAKFEVPNITTLNKLEEYDELDDIPPLRLASLGVSASYLSKFLGFVDPTPTAESLTDEDILSEERDKSSDEEDDLDDQG